jgi:hypothetical protein
VRALDVLIVQQDATPKARDLASTGMDLRFTQAEHERHLKSGVAFYQDVEVKPSLATFRLLVLDRGSGTLGSLIIPASRIGLVGLN